MGVFLFESQSREHRVSRVQWSSGQSAETSRSRPTLHGGVPYAYMEVQSVLLCSIKLNVKFCTYRS